MSIIIENIDGLNNLGSLKPIEEGKYKGLYKVVGGGLNVINSQGHLFPDTEEVRKVFDKSSTLRMFIERNVVKGEIDHPTIEPGEDKRSFAQRFMSITAKNVSHLIVAIEIGDPISVPNSDQPNKVIPIYLYIDPIGPYGKALIEDLENPNSNTGFSIRCLSKRGTLNGRVTRTIYHVITWDWVSNFGVSISDKKTALATRDLTGESFSSIENIDEPDIEMVKELINDTTTEDFTTESALLLPSEYDIKCVEFDFLSEWFKGN